ncbi:MAG: hypothetical protein SOS24_02950 [Clostridia bacterium]|nr:hypothetical protein [Clostridia bacterium]
MELLNKLSKQQEKCIGTERNECNMKKLLASLLAASLLAMGTAAFAATYDVDVNGANVPEASGAQTILITVGDKTAAAEITAKDIVYINQSDSDTGFGTAVKFLLKAGITAGTYTVRTNTEPNGTTFTISTAEANGEKAMTGLPLANSPGTQAFTMENVKISEYAYIVVTYNGYTLKYPLSKFSILSGNLDTNIAFGLQITNVPENIKDMAVSLAKENSNINVVKPSAQTETPATEQAEPATEPVAE